MEENKMLNIFKKSTTSALLTVTYRFDNEAEERVQTTTSAGLASLEADPYIIILEVVKA